MRICCWLLAVLFFCGSGFGEDLGTLEDRFAKAQADDLLAHAAGAKKLKAHYLGRLEELAGMYKQAKDEVSLAAVESAKDVTIPISKEAPVKVREAQAIFTREMTQREADYRRSALRLRHLFVQKLELLKATHVQNGDGAAVEAVEMKMLKHALSKEELEVLEKRIVQFFGTKARAKHAVFIVDFSGSMSQGDRINTLRKELDRSLATLPQGILYNVIYYSHRPWLGGEDVGGAPFRDPKDERDRVAWLKSNKKNIRTSREQLAAMTIGGSTNWIPPLELALAMNPPPDVIWLMSDGAATDWKELIKGLGKMNPDRVPIHTVGMDIGGPTFGSLIKIAEKTGGAFSIMMDGRLHKGEQARRFAADEFAPQE